MVLGDGVGRAFSRLHGLRRRHVLVAGEVGRRVRPWIQAATQDNIAVGDADSAIGIVGVGLEPGWGMAAFEGVEGGLAACDVVSA